MVDRMTAKRTIVDVLVHWQRRTIWSGVVCMLRGLGKPLPLLGEKGLYIPSVEA